MTDLFSIRELLEVAIREEQTGAAFYRRLAETTDDDDLEAFALRVAQMEDAHEELFIDLLERCREADIGREPAGDYMSYMAQDRVLGSEADARRLAEDIDDPAEAADLALELERQTLLFFLEMKEFVPEEQARLLHDVIEEERQHVTDWMQFKQRHYG
jgi:rubrerythrin